MHKNKIRENLLRALFYSAISFLLKLLGGQTYISLWLTVKAAIFVYFCLYIWVIAVEQFRKKNALQAARLLPCLWRLVYQLFRYFYNSLDIFSPKNMLLAIVLNKSRE